MPRNDDGEFELVLGNRQLLSVFFLVIVLLGLFFTMGLIMGRSSASATGSTIAKVDNAPTANPIVVEDNATARPSAAGAVVPRNEPKPDTPARTEPAKPEPPPKPEPERAEAKKPEPKKEEPKKAEARKPEPPPAAPAAGGGAPPGTYWQVAAVKRQEADIVSGLVAKRGYRAYLVPLREGSDIYRVLVGPARDKEQQNKMAEDLRADGFKPFQRRL